MKSVVLICSIFVLVYCALEQSLAFDGSSSWPEFKSNGFSGSFSQQTIDDVIGDGLSEREAVASQVLADEVSRQISNVEWLAPLAPVALSPFFGITLLSGLACYGPEWLPDNALISDESPLSNPLLFWTFLVLTVLTSLPRFSKISKPIVQLADFLETYSAIVILLVLKFVASTTTANTVEMATVAGEQAGVLSMGWEAMIAVAMVVNVIVINAVKFFFEILVWITPIPFLDACFETANKSMCAGLIAIYAFSPLVALLINVMLFVVCALVFAWVRRREMFYRTMLVDWMLSKSSFVQSDLPEQLVVFTATAIGDIPARAKCLLRPAESGWTITYPRFIRRPIQTDVVGVARIEPGWWTNSIVIDGIRQFTFSCKYNEHIKKMADKFSMELSEHDEAMDHETSRQVEFA